MSTTTLIGEHPSIQRLRKRLAQVATTPLPVIVVGETGTGKEVVARMVHEHSGRRGPFVPVDCGALSPMLVEAELFGYERGAFTGANQRREGLVHAARGGTFFLDEVGELTLEAQTRLLRLLEQGTFRPLGSEEERRADIRVVAATWRDLGQAVTAGRFRRDLYHRLAVVELELPPLRERPEDIPALLEHFLADAAARADRPAPRLEARLRDWLMRWPWPGNVRELRNIAQYLTAMTRGPHAGLEHLPPRLLSEPTPAGQPAPGAVSAVSAAVVRTDLPYMEARRLWLDDFQTRYVLAVLEAEGGNVSAAARAAGMDRRSIQRILKRAGHPEGSADD